MNLSIDWAGSRAAAIGWGRRGLDEARTWLREVDRRVLAVIGGVLVLALGLLLWVLLTDQSRVLSAREVASLRAWVLSTQAQSVAEAFNEVARDGQITVNEVRQLMEVAKAAELPEGLYQPILDSRNE